MGRRQLASRGVIIAEDRERAVMAGIRQGAGVALADK